MFKLPQDVVNKIKNKFPNVDNLNEIINSIFEEILEKSISDGSCGIHRFGNFYTYKSFSGRKSAYVPRFKFKISRSLSNILIDDPYTISRIDKVVERIFDENKKVNQEQKRIRDENIKNQQLIANSQRKINNKTKENVTRDEISAILSEKFG